MVRRSAEVGPARPRRPWRTVGAATIAAVALLLAGQHVGADSPYSVNVASAARGGIAVALFSQDTFDAMLAIDGELEGARGWAYHGRLDLASIVFAFDQAHSVSRVRLVSGHGMPDHHVTAFELWALYPPGLIQEPPPEAGAPSTASASILSLAIRQREEAECQAFRLRLEQFEQGIAPQTAELPFVAPGWTLVHNSQPTARSVAQLEQGVSGTIMVKGPPGALADVELEIPRTRAIALKVVVRDADSPTRNSVLTEFEAFAEKHNAAGLKAGTEISEAPFSAGAVEHAVEFEGAVDASLSVRILSPENGASMHKAPLRIALAGANLGTGGVIVVVSCLYSAELPL
jgi:hypothetical protein